MRNLWSFFWIILIVLVPCLCCAQDKVSPLPGEGLVQLAERYHVDSREFIKINRQFLVNKNNSALIYTWQKFILPEKNKPASSSEITTQSKDTQSTTVQSAISQDSFLPTVKSENLTQKSRLINVITVLALLVVFDTIVCIWFLLHLTLFHGNNPLKKEESQQGDPERHMCQKNKDLDMINTVENVFLAFDTERHLFCLISADCEMNLAFKSMQNAIEFSAGEYGRSFSEHISFDIQYCNLEKNYRNLTAEERKIFSQGVYKIISERMKKSHAVSPI